MIKFFKHIRQNQIMENKTGKPALPAGRYFKYAIGEIILVVIGILIALQINNWNEIRKEKNIETSILNELHSDFKSDLISLNEDIEINTRAIQSNELITNVLKSKIEYHDSLDLHFGNIQYNAQFTVNTGGFENLKSRGFEIIKNNTLRKAIIELQDKWYDYLFLLNEKNNTINIEQLLPTYRKHFTNLIYTFKDQYVSFTPVNFESLRNNTDFLQLIAYQKFNNEQTLQYLEMIIDRIKDVIYKVESELISRS